MRTDNGLEIDRLQKRYGEVVALDDMTFDLRRGEIFGFVGGNGAGKTTTMRIALGVLEADGGAVRHNGKPVDLDFWRRVGYMPEERGLYPKMKVGEQLEFLAQLHGLNSSDAKQQVAHWLERLGVEARTNDELQSLSLGNQQRVQLAAALVHDPIMLILDEPFSGLDPIAVDVMSGVLREQRDNGIPVLFSSHQLELVERLCDRVGIVNKGTMVACDSVDALRETNETRLVVELDSGDTSWVASLPGVLGYTEQGRVISMRLSPDADSQAILRSAMQAGSVREFAFKRPSLTELFRDVVTSTPLGTPEGVK